MAGEIDTPHGTVIIVPARLDSTRLPRKPLADVAGLPLIVRVCRALEGTPADLIAVATDSEEIRETVTGAGYRALLTGPAESGTHRVHQAWIALGRPGARIINVQGDEPMVEPAWIEDLLSVPAAPDLVTTLARPGTPGEASSPDAVKVGVSGGEASWFSRGEPAGGDFLVHVGVYCFSPESLEACIACGSTPDSRAGRLEQLAWLQNGIRIGVVTGDYRAQGVDTPEDLDRVREIFTSGED
jgi:3-deoxy-manno-octulosonate cytidylyltransferase (CMP-KDO synthetase)